MNRAHFYVTILINEKDIGPVIKSLHKNNTNFWLIFTEIFLRIIEKKEYL